VRAHRRKGTLYKSTFVEKRLEKKVGSGKSLLARMRKGIGGEEEVIISRGKGALSKERGKKIWEEQRPLLREKKHRFLRPWNFPF